MKKTYLFFLVLFVTQFTLAQFNFKQHKIIAGDDVYSIAKEYGTTPQAIYNLNPNAQKGIKPGEILVIPNVIKVPEVPVAGIEFKKIKVKKKQTLYSIAKKFDVSIDDIKRYNQFVVTDGLKKGDVLRIPLPAPKVKKVFRSLNEVEKPITQGEANHYETQVYTVQAKETRYGIARKFGITVAELENMNPNLGVDFPVGIQIVVPEKVVIDSNTISPDLTLYRVPAKQTLYSLSKKFEISTDSILKLNPELAEGLKADMVIQMPSKASYTVLTKDDLLDNLINLEKKRIAILLPFGVSKFSSEALEYENYLEKSKVSRLVVDFYSGVLMALDKAKELGVDLDVVVADTQKSSDVVASLVLENNLETFDAIVGPLYNKNVEKIASMLKNSGVPVFSPISNKVVTEYSNLYQTLPSSKDLQNHIINFVKHDTLSKNIVVIADYKHQKSKATLLKAFPNAKVLDPEDDNYIIEKDLLKIIGKEESELPNYIFLESSSLILVSNVTSLLSARANTHKITLFTTDKTPVYDNESVSNSSLTNLNFHYPSTNKVEERIDVSFMVGYKDKFGKEPNSYAIRGYDLMYDVIVRLCASKHMKDLNSLDLETEYIENKFHYKKTEAGGMVNTASYIVKYSEGLRFEVVE